MPLLLPPGAGNGLAAVQTELNSQEAKITSEEIAGLAGIAPSAGGSEPPSSVAAASSPAPPSKSDALDHVDEFIDTIMAYHVPDAAKIRPRANAAPAKPGIQEPAAAPPSDVMDGLQTVIIQ